MPAIEEAAFILFKSYEALGMNDLRDDARRIIEKSFPQSPYLSRGFRPVENPWYKFW